MVKSMNHGVCYDIGYAYRPLPILCLVVYATKGFIQQLVGRITIYHERIDEIASQSAKYRLHLFQTYG